MKTRLNWGNYTVSIPVNALTKIKVSLNILTFYEKKENLISIINFHYDIYGNDQ